jgi:glycosyltransferase involved in cell wall biosynthesis
MLPPLSVLCITYGRTRQLAELLKCYHRSVYAGEMQLVIVNDAPEQLIVVDSANVTVFNTIQRFSSDGEKRNFAVQHCKHEHFMFIDDDDLFMPWFAQDIMLSYLAWEKPTYPSTHLYAEGTREKTRMRYMPESHSATYLCTKKQFAEVGGYITVVPVGIDQIIRKDFVRRFDCDIIKHPSPQLRAGFVYRWSNEVYHLSGSPDEHPTAWQRCHDDVQRRIDSGMEPTGIVEITPVWEADYIKLALKAMEHLINSRQ